MTLRNRRGFRVSDVLDMGSLDPRNALSYGCEKLGVAARQPRRGFTEIQGVTRPTLWYSDCLWDA